jgi:glutamate 5-kinase
MQKPLLVVKLGTSSITLKDGKVNETLINDVAKQFAQLKNKYNLLLVSSGAVGLGRSFLNHYSGKLSERKAAAAIGNPILMKFYNDAFQKYGLKTAQSLCERGHFSDRTKFLQLRETFEMLWQNDVIPIANENDVVSSLELKFSDNDELATLIAIGFGAEALLIGTSVDGVLDKNNYLVVQIDDFSEGIMGLATKEKSAFGLGGMISKLTFARLATRMGIKVHIFGSHHSNGILDALQEKIGTTCLPKPSSADARKKWLASGSLVTGQLIIDKGAGKALKDRNSLLSVGVKQVKASFQKGEVVEIIIEESDWPLAVARVKISSEELNLKLKSNNIEVAHADDIVIL